jgi:hypothetical protein
MDLEQVGATPPSVVRGCEVPGVHRTGEVPAVRGTTIGSYRLQQKRDQEGRKGELCEVEDAYWYL